MTKLDLDVLRAGLREYFATVTKEQFLADLRQWTPEVFEDDERLNGTPPADGIRPVNGVSKNNDVVPRESV
jgi:hypothetical protein